jgi:hypothetical protein
VCTKIKKWRFKKYHKCITILSDEYSIDELLLMLIKFQSLAKFVFWKTG